MMTSAMKDLRDVGKSPILEQAWSKYNYLDQDGFESARHEIQAV